GNTANNNKGRFGVFYMIASKTRFWETPQITTLSMG
ncbi:unnamed protein product, partial [marine sediment metagenome]